MRVTVIMQRCEEGGRRTENRSHRRVRYKAVRSTHLYAWWRDGIAQLEVVLAQELWEVVQQHQQETQATLHAATPTPNTHTLDRVKNTFLHTDTHMKG